MSSAAEAKVIDIDSLPKSTYTHSKLELPIRAQRAELKSLGLELQKSIELDIVLRNFNHEVNSRIPWCTVMYDHEEMDMHCLFGKKQQHLCSYRLEIERQYLGEMSFAKADKFSKRDIALLENLLCALIYPLRNALKYYQAIQFASTDALTGLGNRFAFDQAMEREINIAERHNTGLSLLMIDVDHFKRVNDTHGHAIGDLVLKHISQAIQLIARGSDLAFRYGGEEFVILLSNTCVTGATLFAERLRSSIEHLECEYEGVMLKSTVSIGVTEYAKHDTALLLLKRADEALYQAKQTGRNRVIDNCL